jgi:hypothetical protein
MKDILIPPLARVALYTLTPRLRTMVRVGLGRPQRQPLYSD